MPPNALAPLILGLVTVVTIGSVLVLRGPLGKALGDRLAGRRGADAGGRELDARQMREELDDVRGQLAELQERMDFAERLLARQRQPGLPAE
jgi:hypothetical protein